MNMNVGDHRSQSAVRDPDWYAQNSSRLKPGSPSTDTTITESMASFGNGSLASLNLDSLNFNFDELNQYSTRSMPALMAHDAPWNESPRSLRSHTPASARRIAALSKPPPGVSPLDHLQNSLSSIGVSVQQERGGGLIPGSIITEEEDQDMTDLNESIASLGLENLHPFHNDMDATAHAGNVTRGSRNSAARGGGGGGNGGNVYRPSPSYSYGSNQGGAYHSSYTNPSMMRGPADEDDDDDAEIIKMLRRQVQTLKSQLAEEQSKNLNNSKNHASFQSSTTSSSFAKEDDDDDDGSDFALPSATSSVATDTKTNVTLTSPMKRKAAMHFTSSMQAIRTTLSALEKPTVDAQDQKLLLQDLQSHVFKLDQEQEKIIKDFATVEKEKNRLAALNEEHKKRIQELEEEVARKNSNQQ